MYGTNTLRLLAPVFGTVDDFLLFLRRERTEIFREAGFTDGEGLVILRILAGLFECLAWDNGEAEQYQRMRK